MQFLDLYELMHFLYFVQFIDLKVIATDKCMHSYGHMKPIFGLFMKQIGYILRQSDVA